MEEFDEVPPLDDVLEVVRVLVELLEPDDVNPEADVLLSENVDPVPVVWAWAVAERKTVNATIGVTLIAKRIIEETSFPRSHTAKCIRQIGDKQVVSIIVPAVQADQSLTIESCERIFVS